MSPGRCRHRVQDAAMVLTLLLSTSTAQSVSTHTERQVGGGGNSSPIGTEGAEVTNRGSGFDNATGTSIALVILYSITGIITALFLMIIITGAVRAHRHPERYGPRAIARFGRPRQSRAKGLARAVLDTIPIVRIGGAGGALEKDAEIQGGQEGEVRAVDGGDGASEGARAGETETETTESPAEEGPSQDQCPVCMEDFEQGQEVRLLPCRHKFHPDCIDPWLLNVSGSCPLCRIDLHPEPEETSADAAGADSVTVPGPHRPRLSRYLDIARGTHGEERMAALRQLRLEFRNRRSMVGDHGISRLLSTRRRSEVQMVVMPQQAHVLG